MPEIAKKTIYRRVADIYSITKSRVYDPNETFENFNTVMTFLRHRHLPARRRDSKNNFAENIERSSNSNHYFTNNFFYTHVHRYTVLRFLKNLNKHTI